MNEVVLDASVVLKWFTPTREARSGQAETLQRRYHAGSLTVVVPTLLFWEMINIAGRRWAWPEQGMSDLAVALKELGFDVAEPDIRAVARWTSAGLTAYDACYVALAHDRGIPLVTDDARIISLAGPTATALHSLP